MFQLSERGVQPISIKKAGVQPTNIKVVGVGGCGCNTINFMYDEKIEGVQYIVANTDLQCLQASRCEDTIQLGASSSGGQGAGADPEKAREFAEEDREEIRERLEGSNMVFIAAGMGGGTGTGASPVFSEIARKSDALTVAVVTMPFDFEGGARKKIAEEGLRELRKTVDSLIVIPNERMLSILDKDVSFSEACASANKVLYDAVKGIAELITRVGFINLDFEDVKRVMTKMGDAVIGTGTASGEQRAYDAVTAAIQNPLLDEVDLQGVRGVLVNITANEKFGLREAEEIGKVIRTIADKDALISIGVVIEESMGDDLRVTLVATGLVGNTKKEEQDSPAKDRVFATPKPVSLTPSPTLNYDAYDSPAFERKSKYGVEAPSSPGSEVGELLDVPAFLNKQAD